jgi:ribosomal protein S27AE
MSILKYYKVDSDGKIKRLRRECPTAECGAGVFVRSSGIFLVSHLLNFCCSVDGLPQRPPVLWQVWSDLHFRTWHQAARCVD